MGKLIGFDDESIARARKLGAEEMARSPVLAAYLVREDSVIIKMPSGTSVKIPRPWIEELRDLSKSALKRLRLDFVREAIEVPPYDYPYIGDGSVARCDIRRRSVRARGPRDLTGKGESRSPQRR